MAIGQHLRAHGKAKVLSRLQYEACCLSMHLKFVLNDLVQKMLSLCKQKASLLASAKNNFVFQAQCITNLTSFKLVQTIHWLSANRTHILNVLYGSIFACTLSFAFPSKSVTLSPIAHQGEDCQASLKHFSGY